MVFLKEFSERVDFEKFKHEKLKLFFQQKTDVSPTPHDPFGILVKNQFHIQKRYPHTGQCKRTGGCYNELVVAFFSTGGGVKGKKNLYLLTLLFIYKLAFILFVMTPGAQTTGNIAVYGSAKQLVI